MTTFTRCLPERSANKHRARGLLALGALALMTLALLVPGSPATRAEPSQDAVAAIDARYTDFGGSGSLLGLPVGPATELSGGAERAFAGGYIYYSPDTGAKVMYGAIGDKYRALGGPEGSLGFPTNDESGTGDGVGRFNDFAAPGGAAIYWNPQSRAWVVRGEVLTAWRESGDVTGPFGYPIADMLTVNGIETGQFAGPTGTEIRWSEADGLVTVPTELAATLPGFRAAVPNIEGTVPVPTLEIAAPTVAVDDPGINKWWGIPIGLAAAAAAGGLMALIGRRQPAAAVPSMSHAHGFVAQKAEPLTAHRFDTAAMPKAPVPAPTERSAPPAPKPVRSSTLGEVETGKKPVREQVRRAPLDRATTPMIKREDVSSDSDIPVTYENNAIGINQRSANDKSDPLH